MSVSASRAMLDRRMTEKQWQAQVIEYARLRGWLVFHPFDSRRSTEGFPDLVMVRAPRLIFAELKTATGKLRPQQETWLHELGKATETYLWRPEDWPIVESALA